MNINSFAKKILAVWMVIFFVSTPILGARLAYAQTSTILDIPRALEWIKDSLKDFIQNTMYVAVVTALINAVSYAADRVAYDAAVQIATGGNAEEPLFEQSENGTYLSEIVTGMAGEAIGTLDETITGAGGFLSNFNLCAPSTPYIMLQFKLGIKGVFDRPEPKCDFNKMFGPEGTWAAFTAELAGTDDGEKSQIVLTELANMYDPVKSEFGAGLQLSTDIFGETLMIPLVKTQENIKNSGFQPAVDFITGNVETPAEYINAYFAKSQADTMEDRKILMRELIADGKILQVMGTRAASVFTNTLISKYQERIWGGMFDFDTTISVNPFDPESFSLSTSQETADRYRSLLAAAPLQISNYSIISDFVTCPGSDTRGLFNCVIDTQFASAIAREEMGAPITIEEAIDEGLLDGSWPLIPAADVARNQDAFCYTYGFCYGNLVKLRKARIISIGWELAANSSENSVESPVTLQEVVDGFDSCGSDGLPDNDHPWCKMIDPDWVLKYPDTQCRMQTNGELLLTDDADERAQVCVDMPSCINEDEDGNCTGGYGYCVAEENTWKFRGESCPEYAASCLVFEDSEGVSTALLKNTVDPGPCTEDTVGCRWYATEKEEQEDGSYAYAAISSIADEDADNTTYASRIYANSQIEACDEENGGCATLIERSTDLRLNAVYNPSFEEDEDADDRPDGWYEYHLFGSSWPSEITIDTGYAREGGVAVSPGQGSTGLGALYQPGIELGQARTYTLSFYARQSASGGTDSASVVLNLSDENGTGIDISGLAITGDCDDSYTNIFGSVVSTGVGIEAVTPGSDAQYDRFTCTFTVPPLADTSLRIFGDLYLFNFDGYIDSVQLEQGEDVSIATIGYSESDYSTIVAKVAPAYLGCTGSEDDPAECANYAQVCSEQDMGCNLYTPVNGDPAISGIATELDTCPAECAGYDTYRQEATRYEPDGIDSVHFIPDTATDCSAEEVGCDEFTNLATEEQEYYSFLRACVTEAQALTNVSSDNKATYYTWEGSDEDGYQLRTWSLLESNAGSSGYTHTGADGVTDAAPDLAPCSNWVATESGITCNDTEDTNGDGYYDWDSENCNARADIFTNANCREFYDESGNIHYRDWEMSVTVNDACQSYRKTTLAGDSATAQQATCENSGGYYVAASGECRYYGYAEESTSCDSGANGCREYAGGRSRNSRLVLEEVFESGTLNQWDAASAAYATYSNESLAADGHSMLLTGPVTSFIAGSTTECTDAAGCEGAAVSFGGECTISEGGTYCGTLDNELYAGKTYTVSVVAKGTGTLEVGFDFNAVATAPEIDLAFDDAVELEDGWQILTLGPLIMDADEYPLFGDGTSLVLNPTGSAYVDNIVIREGEEGLTVIRDSWVTPASCDESVTGDYSPQYYLGCQEYIDQNGDTAYLKSLSSLCDEENVGCAAFFKTQESESTVAQTFNATCNNIDADASGEPDVATSATACYYFYKTGPTFDTSSPYLCTIATGETSCLFSQKGFTPNWEIDVSVAVSYGPETVISPADQAVFLVVNSEVECDTDAAGCTELGDPQWSQDRNSTEGADSVYLMNLPDTYSDILCAHEELFCDAFTTTDATTFYFKSPIDQVCEYRTDVTINGVVYSGWFREGTDSFCYGTCEDSSGIEGAACGSSADCASGETCDASNPSYVVGGTESGIWNNGDSAFSGWAGSCSAAYDTCTEFQDKLAQNDGEIYGETNGTSYFYLNDDSLSEYGFADSQKCNGQVSLKNGCAMFYDTGDTSLTANASATEIASRHADELFGSEPYGLVDPIDCENGGDTTITTATGEEIDLCATRCVYDYGEVHDLTDGTTYQDKLDSERTSSSEYDRDEMYVFGGSCYSANDCTLVDSESGASVEAITCARQVRVDPFSSLSPFSGSFETWRSSLVSAGFNEVPRQENDVNAPLKVNRDRSCAEWLSCVDTSTQWDEATASFVTTCSDVALCTGYDATTGGSFCSEWDFEKPEVIFDTEWYASRDTSWYGNEYSGMAIPNLFPVQSLTQADVSPVGYCEASSGSDVCPEGIEPGEFSGLGSCGMCLSPEDAVEAGFIESVEYAMVLDAGTCNEDYGDICSVGYCEENGAACASSDQCASGACVVGACYTISATECQTAETCAEGQTCYGGACADVGITVEIEDYDAETAIADSCIDGETFVQHASMKLGSCINSRCLLTPDGEQYENGTTEGKLCRAYPEATSPFPNEVVNYWYTPSNPGSVNTSPESDALPYDMISGFENVVTCAYGEDCDCSYTKATFGEGVDTRYYSMNWSSDDISLCSISGNACSSDSECEEDGETCDRATDELGICQTGDRAGAYCTTNEQCGESGESCAKITRQDVLYGLNGFCLEKDTSLSILGDREKQACLSWLPVDQLAGDSDLRAKYTEAGYFADTFVCANVDAMVELGTSSVPEADGAYSEGDIACAETDYVGLGVSKSESYDEDALAAACAGNATCPEGYWVLMGQIAWEDRAATGTNMASACAGDTVTKNGCPYVCVPYGAYAEGLSCDPLNNGGDPGDYVQTIFDTMTETSEWDYRSEVVAYGNENVFIVGDGIDGADDVLGFEEFDSLASAVSLCRTPGVEFTDELAGNIFGLSSGGSRGDEYRHLSFTQDRNSFGVVGCEEVLKVSDAQEFASYAFTDRLLYTNSNFVIDANEYDRLAYDDQTTPTPYGFILTDPETRSPSESAIYVASCIEGETLVPPNGTDHLNACAGDTEEYTERFDGRFGEFTTPSTALARTFLDFSLYIGESSLTSYVADIWGVNPMANARVSAFSRINQLFAGVNLQGASQNYAWSTTWGAEGVSDEGYVEADTTLYEGFDVRADEGVPPTVWSVNTTACSDDGLMCEEGTEGRITLNSQETGDQSASQFFSATIKFFAAADKNQLPIRRIMVDWGDDINGGSYTGSDADDNFYKNARGLQDGTQNSKCDLDSEWGLTDESCDPYFFSYSHIYTCSSEILRDSTARCSDSVTDDDDDYDSFPCWIDQSGDTVADACVFKPRVHVRDNWGFCTGTCTTGEGEEGNPACFDSGSISSLEGDMIDECVYTYGANNYSPYVEYDGVIIVTP